MNRKQRFGNVFTSWSGVGLLAIGMVTAGCGSRLGADVGGRITIAGEPAPHGMIVFHPVDGGPLAASTISSSGSYRLTTAGEKTLPPGEYLVTITVVEERQPPSSDEVIPPVSLIDERYGSKETSGLTCVVERGGSTVDYDLDPPPQSTNP